MINPPNNNTPDKALVEEAIEQARLLREPLCAVRHPQAADVIDRLLAALSQPQPGGLVEAAKQMVAAWAGSDEDAMECAEANLRRALAGKPLTYALSNSPVVGEDERLAAIANILSGENVAGGITRPINGERWVVMKYDQYARDLDRRFERGKAAAAKPTPTDTADRQPVPLNFAGPETQWEVAADRREAIAQLEETLGALEGKHGDGGIRITMSERRLFAKLLREYIASLIAVPDGMVLVPREPTMEMLHAGSRAADGYGTPLTRTENAYRAMIAAATGEAS